MKKVFILTCALILITALAAACSKKDQVTERTASAAERQDQDQVIRDKEEDNTGTYSLGLDSTCTVSPAPTNTAVVPTTSPTPTDAAAVPTASLLKLTPTVTATPTPKPTPKPADKSKTATKKKPAKKVVKKMSEEKYPDYFTDLDGKKITGVKITNKDAVKYYYKVLEVLKKHDKNYWTEVLPSDEYVEIKHTLNNEKDDMYYELMFFFSTKPEMACIDYPYQIDYQYPSKENEQILKETLKIYYPKKYKTLFNKMMTLYKKIEDGKLLEGTWKYTGSADGRNYFVREMSNGTVTILIGK